MGRTTGRRVEQEVQLGVRHEMMVTWTRIEAVEVVTNIGICMYFEGMADEWGLFLD